MNAATAALRSLKGALDPVLTSSGKEQAEDEP
jgi:hypothetical protein